MKGKVPTIPSSRDRGRANNVNDDKVRSCFRRDTARSFAELRQSCSRMSAGAELSLPTRRFRARKSQNKALTGFTLLLINHQRLLIKLISQPEIELLITAGTPENQRIKGADWIDVCRNRK